MTKISNNKNVRITNNKLSKEIIIKLMKPSLIVNEVNDEGLCISSEFSNVTKHELGLLLYLSTIQNNFGNVKGVYYKDACAYLDCCKQTFYNALKGLELKHYIQINFQYKESNYWDLTILDNIFMNAEDDKKGYFNTNKKFLHIKEFKKLRVNEQKLLLYISYIYNPSKGLYIYPSKVCQWLGVESISLAWSYLNNISILFPFAVVNGKHGDKIKFSKEIEFISELNINSERENFLSHKIKYLCKKRHIEYTSKDIKDLIILLAQKAHCGIGKVISVINYVLDTYNSIESALINKLLTKNIHTNKFPELYLE